MDQKCEMRMDDTQVEECFVTGCGGEQGNGKVRFFVSKTKTKTKTKTERYIFGKQAL